MTLYIKEHFVSLKDTLKFGVDKIHLFTDAFQVDDTTAWNIAPNTKQAGKECAEQTPLFMCNGEQITGKSAYINTPFYSADIKHGKIQVQFNPSKFTHEYHLTHDQDKIADSIQAIQTHLKEVMKTDVDLFSAGLSRVDFTAQDTMSKKVPYYDQVINAARNMKRAPRTEYPNGFLMGNKQRKVCTYDKGLKLIIDQHLKKEMQQPSNFMRVESRLLNARALKTQTMFKNVADILTAPAESFKNAYFKTVNALLPINQAPIQFIEIGALTDLIKTAHTVQGKGAWLALFFAALGNPLEYPSETNFETALKESGISANRSVINRIVRKYTEIRHRALASRSAYINTAQDNYADLHREFIDKLILPYKVAI